MLTYKLLRKGRKQFYVSANYKKPNGSVKRDRLHIKFVVVGPVLVTVTVNLPATAPLFTSATTTIVPENPSTSVPADHYTPVYPAHVPKTTTNTVAPSLLPTTNTDIIQG